MMKFPVKLMAPMMLAGFAAGCGTVSTAAAPSASTSPSASPAPHASKTPAPGHIVLSPTSGPPGTTVTVRGNVPAAAKNPKLQEIAGNILLGSVSEGYSEQALPVSWSKQHPGIFTIKFRIPVTSWISPHGAHRLRDGPLSVGVLCVGVNQAGCGLIDPTLSQPFVISGAIPKSPSAAYLRLSPARGESGTVVHVSGWAPVSTDIGQPFGYELQWTQNGVSSQGGVGQVTQKFNGDVSGTFAVPASLPPLGALKPGPATISLSYLFLSPSKSAAAPHHNQKDAGSITIAPTPFDLLSPLSWADFTDTTPSAVATNAAALSFNAPSPLAISGQHIVTQNTYKGPLWQSDNHGQSWQAVSLTGVAALTAQAGYPSVWQDGMTNPSVTSVTLDPYDPNSLFVTVSSVQKKYDQAPPTYNMPVYTTNDGSSWHMVPVPAGMSIADFGGFTRTPSGILADFGSKTATVAEVTANGGMAWSSETLSAAEPAATVLLGPVPNQNYGQMGGNMEESVLYRTAKNSWSSTSSVGVLGGSSFLGLYPHHTALLISAFSSYPVEYSTNRGKSWQYLALPTPSGVGNDGQPYQQLILLADGSLLASVNGITTQSWSLLAPGATRWQAVPVFVLPPSTYGVQSIGSHIWWDSSTPSGSSTPTLHEVSDSHL